MKNKVIIIEGVDRVGKSSLRKFLQKKYNFCNVVHDRAELSVIVYGIINFRTIDYDKLISDIQNYPKHYVKVFLYSSDIDLLEQRRIDTEHEEVNFSLHQSLFKEVIDKYNLNYIEIDVLNKSLEQISDEIELMLTKR